MTTHKLAAELQPGDRVLMEDETAAKPGAFKPVTVKAVSRGMIAGHILIDHTGGWSNVPKGAQVELAPPARSKKP